MKIIPLSEGAFTVDGSKAFIPFDEQKDFLKERPVGSILVEVQPFVIVTDKDILLLDTGLGFSDEQGTLLIHDRLRAAGIDVSEVTKVLMSHLHKDHSGGVGLNGIQGSSQLSFPRAKYFVQRKELEYALSGASSSYIRSELQCLDNHPQVELIDGNGLIDDYITYEMTGAHCRYHQVFWIREQGQIVFFGGDDAPQYQQMKSRYVAKYDYDGKKCMQLRQQWLKQGEEEHWTFLFYHDIKTPTISL